MPLSKPSPSPPIDSSGPEAWIPIGGLVEEICRSVAAKLPGAPAVVDCASGLEIPAGERNRIVRALACLIVRTAAGLGTGGIEVVARPAGSAAAPALLFAVQAISKERRTIRGGTGFDPEELTLARELVERGGGRLLITRQLLGERRSMFGIDARWRLERAASLRLAPPPAAVGKRSGGQLSGAVSPGGPSEPPRYVAAEMPYSLSRW
jgi:hypothetical protein